MPAAGQAPDAGQILLLAHPLFFQKWFSTASASMFPGMAFSISFLLQKNRAYRKGFLEYPGKAQLETNFKVAP